MNETKNITMTVEQAEVVALALHKFAQEAETLGNNLIEHTNSRQAGFNQIDRARRADEVLAQIDLAFPEED